MGAMETSLDQSLLWYKRTATEDYGKRLLSMLLNW